MALSRILETISTTSAGTGRTPCAPSQCIPVELEALPIASSSASRAGEAAQAVFVSPPQVALTRMRRCSMRATSRCDRRGQCPLQFAAGGGRISPGHKFGHRLSCSLCASRGSTCGYAVSTAAAPTISFGTSRTAYLRAESRVCQGYSNVFYSKCARLNARRRPASLGLNVLARRVFSRFPNPFVLGHILIPNDEIETPTLHAAYMFAPRARRGPVAATLGFFFFRFVLRSPESESRALWDSLRRFR